MIIDVESLPEEGLEFHKEFEFFSQELVDENAVFLKPVMANVHVQPVGEEEFLIKGNISTRLSFICSRCLSPYEFPIDSQFDLVFFPEELDVLNDQLDSEDMNLYFYSSRKIDLHEVVLEQLNLTFPYKPLCSLDCQGICPVCGKVVRNGRCSCTLNESDPRLDKLKNFFKR